MPLQFDIRDAVDTVEFYLESKKDATVGNFNGLAVIPVTKAVDGREVESWELVERPSSFFEDLATLFVTVITLGLYSGYWQERHDQSETVEKLLSHSIDLLRHSDQVRLLGPGGQDALRSLQAEWNERITNEGTSGIVAWIADRFHGVMGENVTWRETLNLKFSLVERHEDDRKRKIDHGIAKIHAKKTGNTTSNQRPALAGSFSDLVYTIRTEQNKAMRKGLGCQTEAAYTARQEIFAEARREACWDHRDYLLPVVKEFDLNLVTEAAKYNAGGEVKIVRKGDLDAVAAYHNKLEQTCREQQEQLEKLLELHRQGLLPEERLTERQQAVKDYNWSDTHSQVSEIVNNTLYLIFVEAIGEALVDLQLGKLPEEFKRLIRNRLQVEKEKEQVSLTRGYHQAIGDGGQQMLMLQAAGESSSSWNEGSSGFDGLMQKESDSKDEWAVSTRFTAFDGQELKITESENNEIELNGWVKFLARYFDDMDNRVAEAINDALRQGKTVSKNGEWKVEPYSAAEREALLAARPYMVTLTRARLVGEFVREQLSGNHSDRYFKALADDAKLVYAWREAATQFLKGIKMGTNGQSLGSNGSSATYWAFLKDRIDHARGIDLRRYSSSDSYARAEAGSFDISEPIADVSELEESTAIIKAAFSFAKQFGLTLLGNAASILADGVEVVGEVAEWTQDIQRLRQQQQLAIESGSPLPPACQIEGRKKSKDQLLLKN